jgi:hypothetical protein
LGVQRQNALILRPILRLIVVVLVGVAVIVTAFVLVGVVVIVVVLVLAPVVLVLAELVLDYLIPVVLVVFGDPPVALSAVVMIVAFVLAKDADLLVAAAFVLVLAEPVLDYLVSAMLFVLGDPLVALIAIVLAKDADLIFIPTAARGGGIPPGGRACGASSSCGTRCTRCRSWGAYSG